MHQLPLTIESDAEKWILSRVEELSEHIITVFFEEVNLVKPKCKLLLSFEHVLLELFEGECWDLRANTTRIVEQFLKLPPFHLLLCLWNPYFFKVLQLIVEFLNRSLAVYFVWFLSKGSRSVKIRRNALELALQIAYS
jgi:hypothetical protein